MGEHAVKTGPMAQHTGCYATTPHYREALQGGVVAHVEGGEAIDLRQLRDVQGAKQEGLWVVRGERGHGLVLSLDCND